MDLKPSVEGHDEVDGSHLVGSLSGESPSPDLERKGNRMTQ